MRRFTKKFWAALLLLLVSMQSVATDVFTSNRTDFRDESIYFMMTTRFYDGCKTKRLDVVELIDDTLEVASPARVFCFNLR